MSSSSSSLSDRNPFVGLRVVCVGHATIDELVSDEEWEVGRPARKPRRPSDYRVGGKALNQAVAAARLGASVSLVTAVGTDKAGSVVSDFLKREGVSTRYVVECGSGRGSRPVPTVVVRLTEGRLGERQVLVEQSRQMESCLSAAVSRSEQVIQGADVVFATIELPDGALTDLWAVLGRSMSSRQNRPLVVLNPAPASTLKPAISGGIRAADVLVPNRSEALALLGERYFQDGVEVARELGAKFGVTHAVVTMGESGCAWSSSGASGSVPPIRVDLQDKVGASDVFCAALGLALRLTGKAALSTQFANLAAACSVEHEGAAQSSPRLPEMRDRIDRLPKSDRALYESIFEAVTATGDK